MASHLRPAGAATTESEGAAPGGQKFDEVRAVLGGLAESLCVLQAQLVRVNEATAEAAGGMVVQTTTVQGQLNELIGLLEKEAARLLKASMEEGLRIAEEEDAVKMLQRYLDRTAQDAHDEASRAHRIEEAVAGAGPVLAELRDLAMQSKVLSINASVEAARQRGAFSVIADEVRRVSQRSALAVTQVEDAIKRVAAVVGSQFTEASVKAQAEDAADRARLQHFAELVARRAEGQRVAEAQRQKLLTDVARQHDDLSRRVVQLLAMTQFQDVCGQQVDGVRKALEQGEQVIRGIAQALAPGATGTVASTLDASALLQTYVMGSQREAHAAVTGAAFVDDTDRIELF